MKIKQILAVSVLASAVIFSGTACSSQTPNPEENRSSATVTPSPQINSTDSTEDTVKILQTVNGYYDFITTSGSSEKIKAAGAPLTGKEATDEELQTFAKDFPEGFSYFDTSSPELIKSAYTVMSVGAMSLQQQGNVKISAPEEAVAITGDTATVNTTWISVTKNEKSYPTSPESNPDPSDLIQLVKKDDGSWVIVPNSTLPKPTVP